eukprot:6049261-Amphidinium_carterae.1
MIVSYAERNSQHCEDRSDPNLLDKLVTAHARNVALPTSEAMVAAMQLESTCNQSACNVII